MNRTRHRARRTMAAFVAAFCTIGTTALAEPLTQSLPLNDVLLRTRSSPQVRLQVRLQLARAKLKHTDVICQAQVMDRSWLKMSGRPLGPYECPIGPRTLVVTSKPNYVDAHGVKVRRSDPQVKERAVDTRETRFKLRWKKPA